MPVPPPEPFVPFRYAVDGNPGLIGNSHGEWVRAAQHLHQLAADMVSSARRTHFEGPEAELWRQQVVTKAEALTEAATGIQTAGEGLGDWSRSLAIAQQRMAPVAAAAQLAHSNVVRATARVNAAEAVLAVAEAALASAEAELSAATAAAAATLGAASGAVAAASAHVAQASAEFARAASEVTAALTDHAGWFGKWNEANAEADSIQAELGDEAGTSAGTVQQGNARHANVQGLLTQSRPDTNNARGAFNQAQSVVNNVQNAASQVQSALGSAAQGGDGGSNDGGSSSDSTSTNTDQPASSTTSAPASGTSPGSDAPDQGGVGAGAGSAAAAGAAAGAAKSGKGKQKSSEISEPEPSEDCDDEPVEEGSDVLDDLSIGELGQLLAEQLLGTIGRR